MAMMDIETLEMMLLEVEEKMGKSLDVLKGDVVQIRAGRANPHILDKIQVEAYGGMSPINQIGNISVSDGQCLVISPWDKSLLKSVEKAIQLSNIGINPTNDGNVVRLVFPMLTDERRREIVKQVKKMGEDGKVAIRNIRRDGLDTFKKLIIFSILSSSLPIMRKSPRYGFEGAKVPFANCQYLISH